MRKSTALALLFTGLALGYSGVGIATAGSDSASGLGASAEWDRAAWLASLSDEQREVVLHPIPAELPKDLGVRARYERPSLDIGSSADVAVAKSEVRRLKVADAELSALPQGRTAQVAEIARGASERERRTAEIWAPKHVVEESALLEHGLATLGEDATYTAYDEADFVVEQWQGVQIDHGTVYARALGHMRYHTHKLGWVQDRTLQYQFHLVWAASSRARLLLDSWAAVRLPDDATGA